MKVTRTMIASFFLLLFGALLGGCDSAVEEDPVLEIEGPTDVFVGDTVTFEVKTTYDFNPWWGSKWYPEGGPFHRRCIDAVCAELDWVYDSHGQHIVSFQAKDSKDSIRVVSKHIDVWESDLR